LKSDGVPPIQEFLLLGMGEMVLQYLDPMMTKLKGLMAGDRDIQRAATSCIAMVAKSSRVRERERESVCACARVVDGGCVCECVCPYERKKRKAERGREKEKKKEGAGDH